MRRHILTVTPERFLADQLLPYSNQGTDYSHYTSTQVQPQFGEKIILRSSAFSRQEFSEFLKKIDDISSKDEYYLECKGVVVPGGAGCEMAHTDFGRSVNPISTRGTDYAHLITTGTPGFSDLPTALYSYECKHMTAALFRNLSTISICICN